MAKSGGRKRRPQGCSLRSHRLRRLKPLTPTLSPATHSAMPSMLPCCTSDLKRRRFSCSASGPLANADRGHFVGLGASSVAAELRLAPIGNAPWPVRLSSDAVQVRKEILGQARIGRPKRYLTAIIMGSVVLSGLGLGWLSRSTHLFAPPNKPVSSHCAVDSDQETICAIRTSDHLGSPAPISTGPQDAKAISLPTKQATLPPAPTALSFPTKQTTLSPAPTAVDPAKLSARPPAKLSARPVAVPETRPATIKGWTVRNVIGGTAVLEGPSGIRNVRRGDIIHATVQGWLPNCDGSSGTGYGP